MKAAIRLPSGLNVTSVKACPNFLDVPDSTSQTISEPAVAAIRFPSGLRATLNAPPPGTSQLAYNCPGECIPHEQFRAGSAGPA